MRWERRYEGNEVRGKRIKDWIWQVIQFYIHGYRFFYFEAYRSHFTDLCSDGRSKRDYKNRSRN